MSVAHKPELESHHGGPASDSSYARSRQLPRFNFATRPVSFDLVAASADDRVIAALIPVAVFVLGFLVQLVLAHRAEAVADQLRMQVVAETPAISQVRRLGETYAAARQRYLADEHTRLSGPLLARSLSRWMGRLSPSVSLAQVVVSQGGAAITISGEGPSMEAVRAGVVASFEGACKVGAFTSPLDCAQVASATLHRSTKGHTLYSISTAASPSPSPAPAASAQPTQNGSAAP